MDNEENKTRTAVWLFLFLNYSVYFDTGCRRLQSCILNFGLHFNATR